MAERLIRRWIRFSIRSPWLVLGLATATALLFGNEARKNFNIRSNLADLLPDTKESVANHRWVYQFAGAPEVVEPIIAVKEPLADSLVVTSKNHDGLSEDIGSLGAHEEGKISFILRKPLFKEDVDAVPLSLRFDRDRNPLKLPALSGLASQSGKKLTLKLDKQQWGVIEEFRTELRVGDPNSDGIFAMDVAQKGLNTIAQELEALDSVVFVLHRMELEYFKDNILLFASTNDLKQLKCCVEWKQKESIRAEFSLGDTEDDEDYEEDEDEDDPFADDAESEEDPDCNGRTLDNESCGLSGSRANKKSKGMPEYFVSSRGYLAMFVRPSTPSNQLAANKKTQSEIRETILKAIEENKDSFGWAFVPSSLQLGGGFVTRHDAVRRIEADLFKSVGITLALLFVILLFYYRKGRALFIILLPLIYGVLEALGVAFLVIGYLNLITTFIFAVLLGLGIDFGIHIMNRYGEERLKGETLEEALARALCSTGVATAMGAITTAASFATLMMTAFPGFSQFGLIAGVGVPLCLLNVFALMPPMTSLWETWRPVQWEAKTEEKKDAGLSQIARFMNPGVTSLILLACIALGALSFIKVGELEFEYDMRNVRSLNPEMDAVKKNKSGTTEGLTLSPAIALGETKEHASLIYSTLKSRMTEDPGFDSIEQLIALDNLVPEEQKTKLSLIQEIRSLLRKKRDFVDNEDEKKKVDDLYKRTRQEEITTESIPESLLRFFRGKPRPIIADITPNKPEEILPGMLRWLGKSEERSLGHFIYIFPGKDMTDVRNCIDFANQMGSIQVRDKPLLMSASQFIYGDLLAVVKEDGAVAVLLAFYAVFLCVLIDFAFMLKTRSRWFLSMLGALPLLIFFVSGFANPFPEYDPITLFKISILSFAGLCLLLDRRMLGHSVIVLTPLMLSFTILLAALPALGWRINFFNVVVFPTILGIGVDSGIHIYHRFLEEGSAKIPSILRHTGSSIALATLTTGIGFGAMIDAAHLGLQSIAKLAIVGLLITLLSAVVFFPCMLHFLSRKGWIPRLPEPGA